MHLPLPVSVEPMLARLQRALPAAGGFAFEPKWDGFRCLVFRDGAEVDLRSRNGRPFSRYFPEVVAGLRAVPVERFVLDGELLAGRDGRADFPSLLLRLHPAASRVRELARETPAVYVAFDLLAVDGEVLCDLPFVERRARLEKLLADPPAPVSLTPVTTDVGEAERWLAGDAPGVDGVVAKQLDGRYQPGARRWIKVKRERTADCVVAGFRWYLGRPEVGSLLLGLYDAEGTLRHIGIASGFAARRRRELVDELAPYATPLEEHPWRNGFALERGPVGRLSGAGGRWMPDMPLDWVPLRPGAVCEVVYDRCDGGRFRHPSRFSRWRPDRDPASCTLDQLDCAP